MCVRVRIRRIKHPFAVNIEIRMGQNYRVSVFEPAENVLCPCHGFGLSLNAVAQPEQHKIISSERDQVVMTFVVVEITVKPAAVAVPFRTEIFHEIR